MSLSLDDLINGAPARAPHRVLAAYLRVCEVSFTVAHSAMPLEQILQPEFIMPVISLEALRIWKSLRGEPAHLRSEQDLSIVVFQKGSQSLFPVSAYMPALGQDPGSVLRMLTLCLATRHVLGIKDRSSIELTPFIAKWDTIDWTLTDSLPQVPVPESFDGDFKRHEFASYLSTRSTYPAIKTPDPIADNAIWQAELTTGLSGQSHATPHTVES